VLNLQILLASYNYLFDLLRSSDEPRLWWHRCDYLLIVIFAPPMLVLVFGCTATYPIHHLNEVQITQMRRLIYPYSPEPWCDQPGHVISLFPRDLLLDLFLGYPKLFQNFPIVFKAIHLNHLSIQVCSNDQLFLYGLVQTQTGIYPMTESKLL